LGGVVQKASRGGSTFKSAKEKFVWDCGKQVAKVGSHIGQKNEAHSGKKKTLKGILDLEEGGKGLVFM